MTHKTGAIGFMINEAFARTVRNGGDATTPFAQLGPEGSAVVITFQRQNNLSRVNRRAHVSTVSYNGGRLEVELAQAVSYPDWSSFSLSHASNSSAMALTRDTVKLDKVENPRRKLCRF